MHITLLARLRRFLRDRSGSSAVEFAAIMPVLALGTVGVSDLSSIGTQSSDMQGAVRASIQYVMNGGTSMDIAKTQGSQAWAHIPSGGTITVTISYFCGVVAGTANTLCADGTVPTAYVTAMATATLGGDMLHWAKTVVEKVRVQ